MKTIKFLPVLFLLAVAAPGALANTSAPSATQFYTDLPRNLAPAYLRCEYLVDPLGIDELNPRLSWIVHSRERGQKQTAYQILVAGSERDLRRDNGDLWDTGKVPSSRTSQIEYKGKPLRSGMQVFWKVRVWDRNGRPSSWSRPAFWTMGLLEDSEWEAQWIGFDQALDAGPEELLLDGAQWIWLGGQEGDARVSVPEGKARFQKEIQLPEDFSKALIAMTADDQFRLFVNGRLRATGSSFKQSHIHDLTEHLKPGANLIAVEANNGSPSPAGLIARLLIRSETGEPQVMVTGDSWLSAETVEEGWETAFGQHGNWQPARALGQYGVGPWGSTTTIKRDPVYLPTPFLHREFTLDKSVRRATLYATSLGIYEIHINGSRVGQDYFTPGWTDYHQRLYYNTYDVTRLLRRGSNAMGGILSDGWYAGNLSILGQRIYGARLRIRAQINVEFTDGSTAVIATDTAWRASYGPILEADMQAGERHDARGELAGWSRPGFDSRGWQPVTVTPEADIADVALRAYPGATIRRTAEINPVSLSEPQPGVFVFDLGQNFAGFARLKVKGKAGDKVVMRFGEMLNADGTVYTENLRSARATDSYILKGGGVEVWEPRFTFHGFQYVEMTGYPGRPALDSITGVVLHSDLPVTSSFDTSNPLLNQLYSNILWSQRGNYFEVPTDCPQRDERMGWTGDTQVFIGTGIYNMDVGAFFKKWFIDLVDCQSLEGGFQNQAPVLHPGASPGWADAGVICPFTIYRTYHDTRVITDHYDAMAKWIEYCKTRSTDLIRPAEGFGDWLAIGSETPKDLVATAYFAQSTRLMAIMARAVGKDADAAKYEDLFGRIKDAFNHAYVETEGKLKGDTQTAYLLALYFDILPEELRPKAAEHLVRKIEENEGHLATGFLGVNKLLPTLTAIGRTDLAYRLIQNTTYPSWGYSIVNGATTIWERWNSYTLEDGFGPVDMNSFNHYAYGSCGEWMFQVMAGIDTAAPGFRDLLIRPQPGGGLSFTKAHYDSINGRITTHWWLEGDRFHLDLRIPANTTATVYIPASQSQIVTEGGRLAASARGVRFLRMEGNAAVFAIESGAYRFASIMP